MTHLPGHAVETGASLLADDAGPGYGAEVVARIGHVGRVHDRDHRRPVDVAGSCRLLAGRRLAGDLGTGSRRGLGRSWRLEAVVRGWVDAMPFAEGLAPPLRLERLELRADDRGRRTQGGGRHHLWWVPSPFPLWGSVGARFDSVGARFGSAGDPFWWKCALREPL